MLLLFFFFWRGCSFPSNNSCYIIASTPPRCTIHTVCCVKPNNTTGNYPQYFVITYKGKESEKEYTYIYTYIYQFNSVQSLSCIRLFVTLWAAAHQASLFITNSQNLLKFISVESVMPSNYLILCRPLLLLTSIFHTYTYIYIDNVWACSVF